MLERSIKMRTNKRALNWCSRRSMAVWIEPGAKTWLQKGPKVRRPSKDFERWMRSSTVNWLTWKQDQESQCIKVPHRAQYRTETRKTWRSCHSPNRVRCTHKNVGSHKWGSACYQNEGRQQRFLGGSQSWDGLCGWGGGGRGRPNTSQTEREGTSQEAETGATGLGRTLCGGVTKQVAWGLGQRVALDRRREQEALWIIMMLGCFRHKGKTSLSHEFLMIF